MESLDPYSAAPGRELDAWIHFTALRNPLSHQYPAYSTDQDAAERLKRILESKFQLRIEAGRTRLRDRKWFAHYEIDPGNATEVLAETYPLAISRLAVMLTRNGVTRS